jgi:hypothetical protein
LSGLRTLSSMPYSRRRPWWAVLPSSTAFTEHRFPASLTSWMPGKWREALQNTNTGARANCRLRLSCLPVKSGSGSFRPMVDFSQATKKVLLPPQLPPLSISHPQGRLEYRPRSQVGNDPVRTVKGTMTSQCRSTSNSDAELSGRDKVCLLIMHARVSASMSDQVF